MLSVRDPFTRMANRLGGKAEDCRRLPQIHLFGLAFNFAFVSHSFRGGYAKRMRSQCETKISLCSSFERVECFPARLTRRDCLHPLVNPAFLMPDFSRQTPDRPKRPTRTICFVLPTLSFRATDFLVPPADFCLFPYGVVRTNHTAQNAAVFGFFLPHTADVAKLTCL